MQLLNIAVQLAQALASLHQHHIIHSDRIVTKKHGGTLQCISSPGQGAEFVIQIPRYEDCWLIVHGETALATCFPRPGDCFPVGLIARLRLANSH